MPGKIRMRARFSGPILGTPVGRRFRVLSWVLQGRGEEECLVIRKMRDVDGETEYWEDAAPPEEPSPFNGTGIGPVTVVGQSRVEFFLEIEAVEAGAVRSRGHSP